MRKVGSFLEKVFERVRDNTALLSGLSIFLMIASIGVSIVARALRYPIPGIFELNEILIVLIVFFALAWTQAQRGHIRVEVFVSRLSPKAQSRIELVMFFIALCYLVLLLIIMTDEAISSVVRQEITWGVIIFPVWPGKIILAIGLLLFLIQVFADLLHSFQQSFISPKQDREEGTRFQSGI